MYANASYKHIQHKTGGNNLWCIGHIKAVYCGEDLFGYCLYDTDNRYSYAPKDLDEERTVIETDKIIARLIAV